MKRRKQSELDMGMDVPNGSKKWKDFRAEFDAKIVSGKRSGTQCEIKAALDHFERLARPAKMEGIRTQTVDAFIASRRVERGKKPGSIVSPATVNKELRHIKAALRIAHEWGYLPKVPKVRKVSESEKLPTYVTPEHFATIYNDACPKAAFPRNPQQWYSACDWWRALVVTAYMTGMRVREILATRKDDVDLDGGVLITRAEDNKGGREEEIPLHPVVVEHLRKIIGFHPMLFRWVHREETLWAEFGRIQRDAGINLPCRGKHEHTPSCHVYGFHDFRRAFATMNEVAPETLQRLMRHKSFTTTLRCINMGNRLRKATEKLYVPDALKIPSAG